MNYKEFIRQIDSGKIDPVYLILAEEPFLSQSALTYLVKQLLDPTAFDFNYSLFDGREATADAVLNASQSLPVFSQHRLVILKNAETMPAAEANNLIDYLKDPCPTTCLVFVAEKVDLRRSFFQTLTQKHSTVSCQPLPESQLPDWILHQTRSLGYRIDEEAINFLIDHIGSDLFNLQNEINKASLIIKPNQSISLRDVQRICGTEGQWSISDLLQAMGERRSDRSILILKNLLEFGEPPLVILSAIARQFRLLFKVKQLLLSNLSEALIQKRLGIWRSGWPRISRQSKAYVLEDLQWIFQRLMETDAGLKGSILPNSILMEMLVLDLCVGKKRSLRRFIGQQHLAYLEREA